MDKSKLLNRELKVSDLAFVEWSREIKTCTHTIARIPATVEPLISPLILYSNFSQPEILQLNEGKETIPISKGRISAFTDWMSLKSLIEQKRSRDIYWILFCGESLNTSGGAEDFVHYLIREIPKKKGDWTSLQKIESALVWEKCPTLRSSELAIGTSFTARDLKNGSDRLVTVANASRGLWNISLNGQNIKNKIEELQSNRINIFRSLHEEFRDYGRKSSRDFSFFKHIAAWILPSLYFIWSDNHNAVINNWNSVDQQVRVNFLGDREPSDLVKDIGLENLHNISEIEFIPFRKSFFFSSDAQAIESSLKEAPGVIMARWIETEPTISGYFRWIGIPSYDLGVLKADTLTMSDLEIAIDLKRRVLQKLVQ